MNFSKIITALDGSKLDKKLIKYSHFIANTFKTDAVLFFHVVPSFMASNILDVQLENLLRKNSTFAKQPKELEKKIYSVFEEREGLEVNLSVVEGKPQDQLLSMIRENKPDLLVLGKKQISNGSGIIARRIARKADCPIWFITEKATTNLKKILVPIDFSSHSLNALKTALYLKEQLKEVTITALHLIDVPMTAYKIDRNKEEIIQRLKAAAENSFRQFLQQNKLSETDIKFKMLLNDNFNVAEYIQKTTAQEKSDLIITGAKGRSGLSRFVFGSVTERLISYPETPPILVVR